MQKKCLVCNNLVDGINNECNFCGGTELAVIDTVAEVEDAIPKPGADEVLKQGFLVYRHEALVAQDRVAKAGAVAGAAAVKLAKIAGKNITTMGDWKQQFFQLTATHLFVFASDQVLFKQVQVIERFDIRAAAVKVHELGCFDDRPGYILSVELANGENALFLEAPTYRERAEWVQKFIKRTECTDGGKVAMTRVDPDSLKEGWLSKAGGSNKAMKRRYFILRPDTLIYCKEKSLASEKGSVPICPSTVCTRHAEKANALHIKPAQSKKDKDGEIRVYYIEARDDVERDVWVKQLQRAATGKSDVKVKAKKKKGNKLHKYGTLDLSKRGSFKPGADGHYATLTTSTSSTLSNRRIGSVKADAPGTKLSKSTSLRFQEPVKKAGKSAKVGAEHKRTGSKRSVKLSVGDEEALAMLESVEIKARTPGNGLGEVGEAEPTDDDESDLAML